MFGDDEEIKNLREEWPKLSYEEKVDRFLWKMVWFHHQKFIPGNPNQAINDLTKILGDASISSEKLTRSIRDATWVAAVVGGLGILIAAINLLRESGIL